MNSKSVEVFTKLLALGARNPSFGLNNILVYGRPGTGKIGIVQQILPNIKVARIETESDFVPFFHLSLESTEDLIIDIDANIFKNSTFAQAAIHELIDSRFNTPLKTIIVTSVLQIADINVPAACAIAARCVLFNFEQVTA